MRLKMKIQITGSNTMRPASGFNQKGNQIQECSVLPKNYLLPLSWWITLSRGWIILEEIAVTGCIPVFHMPGMWLSRVLREFMAGQCQPGGCLQHSGTEPEEPVFAVSCVDDKMELLLFAVISAVKPAEQGFWTPTISLEGVGVTQSQIQVAQKVHAQSTVAWAHLPSFLG